MAGVGPTFAQLELINKQSSDDTIPRTIPMGRSISLGRLRQADYADVVLTSRMYGDRISNKHAAIQKAANGWEITDLSTNGVLVNGVRVLAGTPRPIKDGDSITFGTLESNIVYRFKDLSLGGRGSIDPTVVDAPPLNPVGPPKGWPKPDDGVVGQAQTLANYYNALYDQQGPNQARPGAAATAAPPIPTIPDLGEEDLGRIVAATKAFLTHDTDNNNVLDPYEFHATVQHLGMQMTFKEAQAMFDQVDVSKAGSISVTAFLAWWCSNLAAITRGVQPCNDAQAAFQKHDAQRKGHLNVNEFVAAMKDLGLHYNDTEARTLLDAFDNASGGITEKQFTREALQRRVQQTEHEARSVFQQRGNTAVRPGTHPAPAAAPVVHPPPPALPPMPQPPEWVNTNTGFQYRTIPHPMPATEFLPGGIQRALKTLPASKSEVYTYSPTLQSYVLIRRGGPGAKA